MCSCKLEKKSAPPEDLYTATCCDTLAVFQPVTTEVDMGPWECAGPRLYAACSGLDSPCPISVWAYVPRIWNLLQSGSHFAICSSEPRLLMAFWKMGCIPKPSSPERLLQGRDTVVEQPSREKGPSTLRLAGGRREGAPDPGFPGSSTFGTRANSLEKTLMLGKIEGRRRKGQQRMRW